jgi:transcriptional regulator with XRE-family HTH domain
MGRHRTKTTDPGPLGENVLRIRKDRGWSQDELGKLAGLSRSTIAAIELGKYKQQDTATLDRLASALGITIDQLRAPHGERTSIAPILERFRISPWFAAIQPTHSEMVWVESLGELVYYGQEPTPETIARLIAFRRGK